MGRESIRWPPTFSAHLCRYQDDTSAATVLDHKTAGWRCPSSRIVLPAQAEEAHPCPEKQTGGYCDATNTTWSSTTPDRHPWVPTCTYSWGPIYSAISALSISEKVSWFSITIRSTEINPFAIFTMKEIWNFALSILWGLKFKIYFKTQLWCLLSVTVHNQGSQLRSW